MEATAKKSGFKESVKQTGQKAKAYAGKKVDQVKTYGKNYKSDIVKAYDICNWFIMQRSGDIYFKNMTTAEIATYFSNITSPNIATVTLTLTGTHNTYTYSSQIICTGYTNNTPVNALSLDMDSYVFS